MKFLFIIFGMYQLSFSYNIEDKGREIIAQIVADPAKFFYEMKSDSELTLPVNSGKKFIYNVELFPTLIPFTYINSSINYNLYKEGKISVNIPQIDIFGGFQYMLGGKIAANESEYIDDAKFWGYHVGVLISNSMSSKIRTFYGYKHSYLKANLELNPLKEFEILGVNINSFKSDFNEDSIIFGIETLKDINKYWAIQINYGFRNNTLVGRLSWYGRWFELGFNIYPEGVLVIHPVWILRLGF
ncbi:MAG: hypothetical protein K6357_02290 [Elusimicrobiota bacterium]